MRVPEPPYTNRQAVAMVLLLPALLLLLCVAMALVCATQHPDVQGEHRPTSQVTSNSSR